MDILTNLQNQLDRVVAWLLIAASAVLMIVGYFKVSATPYVANQIPYVISAGLFGLLLLGVGIAVLLSADLRDEWRKLDDLDQRLREMGIASDDPATPLELKRRVDGRS